MAELSVVGIGPGSAADLTPRARQALEQADVIIGYQVYIEQVALIMPEKTFRASGMMREVERCREACQLAASGQSVSLVSSGDAGVYGMAGLVLEIAAAEHPCLGVEIIPGVTAAVQAAAVLGAPLMHDFAVISLSDLMTPWELIQRRLDLAGQGDLVVCLYNPKSANRTTHIQVAQEVLLRSKAPDTPVGLVRNAGRPDESWNITRLDSMALADIDMFTTVIVGNSQTKVLAGRMVTPRGYSL